MRHARPDYDRLQDPAGLIPPEEPVFLLRGQDVAAAETVRHWAAVTATYVNHDPEAVRLACAHADLMDLWPVKKLADVPRPAPPKPPKSHREKILGIPRDALAELLGGVVLQGFITAEALSIFDVLERAELRVRDDCEDDPSFKQLIPYTVLLHPPAIAPQDSQAFCYRRGGGGGEGRLHGLWSLGVGGHVEESDMVTAADEEGLSPLAARRYVRYRKSLFRELHEELSIEAAFSVEGVEGFVNDDSNPVGAVHLGVVSFLRLQTPAVLALEGAAIHTPGFASGSILRALRPQFETWSQLVIDQFWPGP